MKIKRLSTETFYIIVLLIIGLALRLFRLTSESFTPLEVSYYIALNKDLNHLFVSLITHKNISYGFSFFGFVWLKFFSHTEAGARLLSVLFGTSGLFFCFKLLRYFYSRNISFLITLFVCCSPFYIKISQQFIPASMCFFFILLNNYFFWSIAKYGQSKTLKWLFILSGLAAVVVNYISALIFIPQFFFLYKSRKKLFFRKKTWRMSVFLIFLFSLSVLLMFKEYSIKEKNFQGFEIGLFRLFFSSGLTNSIFLILNLSTIVFLFFWIGYCCFIRYKKFKELSFWEISFFVFLILPVLFLFFLKNNCDLSFHQACFIYIFYILFLSNLSRLKNLIIKIILFSFCLFFLFYTLSIYYIEDIQPDYREGFEWLNRKRLIDDRFICFSGLNRSLFLYYGINNVQQFNSLILYSEDALDSVVSGLDRKNVWIILTEKYEYKILNELFAKYSFQLKSFFENQSSRNDFIGIYQYKK